MTLPNNRGPDAGKVVIYALSVLFFAVTTWTSYARWSDFEYRTFDLAYYVQALWQLIHGRFQVSVEPVPLLGNHVEPIVFLVLPLFALFRHPLLFVVVQNAALAAMAPIGYRMLKRLNFENGAAVLLSAGLLLAPATGYIALHEFHPEALTAPFVLLMLEARLARSLFRHWLWFVAVLACKENMALLLTAYCLVQSIVERERGFAELCRWYLWPMCVAIIWLILCTRVITPALNAGHIDYLALYDRLGKSPGDIFFKAISQPQLIGHALFQSLRHGNLVWGLLLPFLFLPLLRPRWVLISAPIFLQHLLSWRSSEWMIFFHYGAPLLPLFWVATIEVLASVTRRQSFIATRAPWLVLVACLISELWLGPAGDIASSTGNWFAHRSDRVRKNNFLKQIPAEASVVAPFPYLSHLAMREKVHSLHYILKGLETLSRARYEPPAQVDFVLLDYLDSATFDPGAGYYHPLMRTADNQLIPSSDQLLHDFLTRAQTLRAVASENELTLLSKGVEVAEVAPPEQAASGILFQMGSHTELLKIDKSTDAVSENSDFFIHLTWKFEQNRNVIPWMLLKLTNQQEGTATVLTKGLCAPESRAGIRMENWSVTFGERLAPGDYRLEALFVNNCRRAWYEATGGGGLESTLLGAPVPLGHLHVSKAASDR